MHSTLTALSRYNTLLSQIKMAKPIPIPAMHIKHYLHIKIVQAEHLMSFSIGYASGSDSG